MGIELNGGSLYINAMHDEAVKLSDNLNISMEYELSAAEVPPISYKATQSAEFSCELSYIDLDILNDISPLMPFNKFTLQYYINIMTQRRWHKKARINKKWLKRYGMKPDTVKAMADAAILDYDYSTDCSFELDCSNHRYILRSDQQRKGLKIAW